METKKQCIECLDLLIGRCDKKFCSDSCRNAYHNKISGSANNLVRNINSILRRNRRILEELATHSGLKTTRHRLLERGFNFDYYTGHRQNSKGALYYRCYEYGFLAKENDVVYIIRDESNLEEQKVFRIAKTA